MEDEQTGYGRTRETRLARDVRSRLAHPCAGLLKLGTRLAGGRDGDDLTVALARLPAPRSVQLQIPMAMQLLKDRLREPLAVTCTLIGGAHLDTSATLRALDPSMTFLALVDIAERWIGILGPHHNIGGSAIEYLGLFSR